MRALTLLFLCSCLPDLSSLESAALCTALPSPWQQSDWAALKDEAGGEAKLQVWESEARCRVYLLRHQSFEVAIDEQSDLEALKTEAGEMALQSAALRDHLEGLQDHNWQHPVPDCVADGERPPRRDGTSYSLLCINGGDASRRLYDMLTWIEEHAGFAVQARNTAACRSHAEHVLNCLQAGSSIDWDQSGEPEQVCSDDLADYGLHGEGPGDFILWQAAQARGFLIP
jgi:hypothetical protein